jgi:hypothetical protein
MKLPHNFWPVKKVFHNLGDIKVTWVALLRRKWCSLLKSTRETWLQEKNLVLEIQPRVLYSSTDPSMSLSALIYGLLRTKFQDTRPMYTPWHLFLTKGVLCPSASPSSPNKGYLSQVLLCPGTRHMQTCMHSVCVHVWREYACVCLGFSPPTCELPSNIQGADLLPLLSSSKMPVRKCHIRFRGGSDVPECMWWTWICLGFPHIHSGVSVAPSHDVGEPYFMLNSTYLQEGSPTFHRLGCVLVPTFYFSKK